ncbi:MAG: DUF4839 domain-containing protein [Acetatifactor sp.]
MNKKNGEERDFSSVENGSCKKMSSLIASKWRTLCMFTKVMLVLSSLSAILFLIAVFLHDILATVISLGLFVLIIFSFLVHKKVVLIDKTWTKYLFLMCIVLLSCLDILCIFGRETNDKEVQVISEEQKIAIPVSPDECLVMKYDELKEQFKGAGFEKIDLVPVYALELSEIEKRNNVESISVNGNTAFVKDQLARRDEIIEIRYLDLKRVDIPISYSDAKSVSQEEIISLFQNAGFVDFETKEIEDLDPDTTTEDFITEVTVNGSANFTEADSAGVDSKIKVTLHLPYRKYDVKVHIAFSTNIFFNRYGVEIIHDGSVIRTLSHGEDADLELRLREGKNTLTFKKKGYTSPERAIDFTVCGDVEAKYKLTCNEDSIQVDLKEYVDYGVAGEDEAIVPASASSFVFENYLSVQKQLEEAGFTNISTAILYDIYWGITSEGSVASVSIDGTTDYTRGKVYKKDVPIVITYHMREEDDPNKPVKNSESESMAESTEQRQEIDYSVSEELKENIRVENEVINVDNSETFAKMMEMTDQTDTETIKKYVAVLRDKSIEFDGEVAIVMQHETYKTRFDICLANTDDKGRVYGPLFGFTNVSYYDMHVTGSDSVAQSMRFHIEANVVGFNEEGNYVELKPISLKYLQ